MIDFRINYVRRNLGNNLRGRNVGDHYRACLAVIGSQAAEGVNGAAKIVRARVDGNPAASPTSSSAVFALATVRRDEAVAVQLASGEPNAAAGAATRSLNQRVIAVS